MLTCQHKNITSNSQDKIFPLEISNLITIDLEYFMIAEVQDRLQKKDIDFKIAFINRIAVLKRK